MNVPTLPVSRGVAPASAELLSPLSSHTALSLLVDQFNERDWETWISAFGASNIYQTWAYGSVHSQGVARTVSRAVLLNGEQPLALVQFRIKRVPLLRSGVAEANWGPVWSPQLLGADDITKVFLAGLKAEYCARRGLDLRFELPARADQAAERASAVLLRNGFTHCPAERPYRTIMLDLSRGLATLRADLDGKWRNALVKAEKSGLEAEFGTSLAHFDRFLAIYNEMWASKRFATGVRLDSIRALQASASEGRKLWVWILKDEGKDIGAACFAPIGDTMLYFLGATSPSGRKNTNPGYLLQWLSIQKAVASGFRWYDFGGLNELPNSNVDLFKVRTGGDRVISPGWFTSRPAGQGTSLYDRLEAAVRLLRSRLKR